MQFLFPDETKELNDLTRKEADSCDFTQLSDGITHYELSGDASAPLIVLVHGFSIPYFIYDPTFEFLVNCGFRVLRYDLFGRGYSDRPHKTYTMQFFINQLAELSETLCSQKSFILAGLSMGGPITAAFVEQYPHKVNKHILIDPTGAHSINNIATLRLAKIPVLAEIFFGQFGTDNLIKSVADDFFDPKLVAHFQARYKIQMEYKGFKRAILSTIRSNMLGKQLNIYKRAGKLQKPTLLLWGKNDKTVPFEHSKDILSALPQAEFHAIDDCGHIPHYEKPEVVNPILLKFARQAQGGM